jgi:hypothetical protein
MNRDDIASLVVAGARCWSVALPRMDSVGQQLARIGRVYSLAVESMFEHPLWRWLTCLLTPEDFEHIVVGLASIVGGLWIVLRLIRERKWDSALGIDIKNSSIPVGNQTLTFIEVRLRNRGKVQLRAKAARTEDGFAFDDGVEKLRYSCSLRLKGVSGLAPDQAAWIDWFSDKRLTNAQTGEINLLNEYEDPKQDNRTEFWMEPGETYKLGVPLQLSDGAYLVKVTFVGDRGDDEFWSRIAVIRVPVA